MRRVLAQRRAGSSRDSLGSFPRQRPKRGALCLRGSGGRGLGGRSWGGGNRAWAGSDAGASSSAMPYAAIVASS